MKENDLMKFVESLWQRGLLVHAPNEFDYEWVIWDYLHKKKHQQKLLSKK